MRLLQCPVMTCQPWPHLLFFRIIESIRRKKSGKSSLQHLVRAASCMHLKKDIKRRIRNNLRQSIHYRRIFLPTFLQQSNNVHTRGEEIITFGALRIQSALLPVWQFLFLFPSSQMTSLLFKLPGEHRLCPIVAQGFGALASFLRKEKKAPFVSQILIRHGETWFVWNACVMCCSKLFI